ncbi:Fam166a [Columba livia]|nr:Fam166a [Columba livia]
MYCYPMAFPLCKSSEAGCPTSATSVTLLFGFLLSYDGFIPQYNYQFGETFGKTTHRLLTDPTVAKSPRPLLAPLHKPKFIEDFSGTTHGDQGYLPGRPGYFPYEKAGAATSFPEPVLGPKPLPVPVDDDLTMTSMDPMSRHYPGEYVLRARMPHGYPRKISCHPATERREWKLPELIPAVRQEKMHNISQLSGALVGSKPPLPIPNWLGLIQYVCSLLSSSKGYTGFIPRYLWVYGTNYVQAVKEAMDEFDRFQPGNYWLITVGGTCGKIKPVKGVTPIADVQSHSAGADKDRPNASRYRWVTGYQM